MQPPPVRSGTQDAQHWPLQHGRRRRTRERLIKFGWQIYEALQRSAVTYGLWDRAGRVQVVSTDYVLVEVHPHACFTVGLGWIPPLKTTLSGQISRDAYLLQWAATRHRALSGPHWPSPDYLSDCAGRFARASWEDIVQEGFAFTNSRMTSSMPWPAW